MSDAARIKLRLALALNCARTWLSDMSALDRTSAIQRITTPFFLNIGNEAMRAERFTDLNSYALRWKKRENNDVINIARYVVDPGNRPNCSFKVACVKLS